MSNLPIIGAVVALLLAITVYANWESTVKELAMVHEAEAVFLGAETNFEKAMESTAPADLKVALQGYTAAAGLLNGLGTFAGWLGQPLKLRCLHRVAAATELLREDHAAVVAGHTALLSEGYCDAVMMDAFDGTEDDQRRQHEACLAPIARGLILFAANPATAEAAFAKVVKRQNTNGSPILTWTTRWQMPDRHVPGLRAQMWWSELEAADALQANAATLSTEFASVLDVSGIEKFHRRRADSWIPVPRDGWGMIHLEEYCFVAADTCALVRKIRGTKDLQGVGYYVLKPGTKLQVRFLFLEDTRVRVRHDVESLACICLKHSICVTSSVWWQSSCLMLPGLKHRILAIQ
jgi:hypothetical protein